MDEYNLGDIIASGFTRGKEGGYVPLVQVVVDLERLNGALMVSNGEAIPSGLPGTKLMTAAELRDYLDNLKKQ